MIWFIPYDTVNNIIIIWLRVLLCCCYFRITIFLICGIIIYFVGIYSGKCCEIFVPNRSYHYYPINFLKIIVQRKHVRQKTSFLVTKNYRYPGTCTVLYFRLISFEKIPSKIPNDIKIKNHVSIARSLVAAKKFITLNWFWNKPYQYILDMLYYMWKLSWNLKKYARKYLSLKLFNTDL